MANSFRRTLRSLEADGSRGWAVRAAVALLFLAGWAAWFWLARISVYAVTPSARLEAERAAHPVEAPVAGRITRVAATLEDWVEEGEVLFELDAAEQERLLEQERALERAIATQLDALGTKLDVDTGAVGQSRRASEAELQETRARFEEARAAQRFAGQERERIEKLFSDGLVAESELERARADAEQKESSAEALRRALDRLDWARELELSDRQGDLSELRRELARLQGERESSRATIARLEHQVDLRKVRASTAGRVGDLARVEAGSFVDEGDRLGTVVPSGEVKVVADFAPASAVGRVNRGQSAKVRLDGFPSIQYGSLSATVTRVSSEVRDGQIRVEMALTGDPPPGLPLQHGLPGMAEVEVERISPAVMVLRAAGKLIGRPTAAGIQEARS